jgi:uncharacterized membrane protein YhaH (DUF805 family)
MNWTWALFSFSGRLAPAEYGKAVGAIVVLLVINAVLVHGAGGGLGLVGAVIPLLGLWCLFAAVAKRLNDAGKSNLLSLLLLVPLVNIVMVLTLLFTRRAFDGEAATEPS